MKLLVRTRLGRRFLITFVLLSLPIITAGWLGIRSATHALRKQTHILLRVASDGAEAQVREFLESLRRTTEARAADETIRSALISVGESTKDLSPLLKRLRARIPEAREIICINTNGKVVASSSPEMIGRDESSSLEFQRGRQSYYPGDIGRIAGTLRWRMSAPVKDPETGRLLGVVAVGFDPDALNALTAGKRALAQGAGSQSFRMGETGETYLVNKDGFLLTESRFAPNSVLALKVKTAPVRAAMERGAEIMADYTDYRGVAVSGASAILADRGWILITEIDFTQASAPLTALRNVLIGLALLMGLAATLIARAFARLIIVPLRIVNQADHALAKGDERSAIVPEENLPADEIGEFIRQRNANVRELFAYEGELLKEQKHRAEAASALEGIAYSMVHDMRAPLRAISTFGDLLEADAGPRLTSTERDYIARMKKACVRMDRLICDMLRYSSLLHAEMPLSPVNVPELLRAVIDGNPLLNSRKASIEIEKNLPPVQGNAAALSQCFAALLDNAFKYARPGITPRVRVWAEVNENWTRLLVEDNGTGIPAQFQLRLFGIFQKGINEPEGTGISLAVVRVALERMGGRVGVISEEGKGSRFWIELKSAARAQESMILSA